MSVVVSMVAIKGCKFVIGMFSFLLWQTVCRICILWNWWLRANSKRARDKGFSVTVLKGLDPGSRQLLVFFKKRRAQKCLEQHCRGKNSSCLPPPPQPFSPQENCTGVCLGVIFSAFRSRMPSVFQNQDSTAEIGPKSVANK